jgi:hypothetical protein
MKGSLFIHFIGEIFFIRHHAVDEACQFSIPVQQEEMGWVHFQSFPDFFCRSRFR